MPDRGCPFALKPDLRRQADLLPLAFAAIDEQEVLDRIVRHEQVHQAVVVDVGADHAERFAERPLDIGSLPGFRERPVTIVVEEQTRRRLEQPRNAVVAPTELVVAAETIGRQREIDEAAQKQIELAIVVVVEPDRARGPARGLEPGPLGDVGERTVAVVVIQRALAVRRHEQIGIAVIVVVADCSAHTEGAARHARLLRDVSERSVSIVLVERVSQRRLRREEVGGTRVHQVDVHPAVVVEIKERASRSAGFWQVAVRRHRVVVHPLDAGLSG